MAQTIQELDEAIRKAARPADAILELSSRCARLAREYIESYNGEGTDKDADRHHAWLSGQWLSIFEVLPHVALTNNIDAMERCIEHIHGISATMKAVNYPWWHLFDEMQAAMLADFYRLKELCEQRFALDSFEPSGSPDERLH